MERDPRIKINKSGVIDFATYVPEDKLSVHITLSRDFAVISLSDWVGFRQPITIKRATFEALGKAIESALIEDSRSHGN